MNIKSISMFRTITSACLLLMLSITQINAQEKGIYEIVNDDNSYLEVNKGRSEFYNLAQKRHTTAYIKNNTKLKVSGEGVTKKIIFIDTNSFNVLNENNYTDVELITIKINSVGGLNKLLDLTLNENLSSLKYIYIRCDFKCTQEQIENFIKAKSNIRIFYRVELPS